MESRIILSLLGIIQYYLNLFCCSNCSLGHWKLPSVELLHPFDLFWHFWSTFLLSGNIRYWRFILYFPYFFRGALGCFMREWCLETKIWALSVLKAMGVPSSSPWMQIRSVCVINVYHLYFCIYPSVCVSRCVYIYIYRFLFTYNRPTFSSAGENMVLIIHSVLTYLSNPQTHIK